jgi:hypothetical protein
MKTIKVTITINVEEIDEPTPVVKPYMGGVTVLEPDENDEAREFTISEFNF